ncbi:6-phosphofructokinase [hydrothermal vent metagenome]|uniref:6-phosphofructokinase n=1 Tax=hydrothermal vent metagenome TaxID=652676 RepID=A0A3B1BST1_9ZZZZ
MNHYNKRLLLVFDGGNAPGYSAVATSLTEEGDKRGYEIFTAFEGFRSLTGDNISDERLIRLVMSRRQSFKLNSQGIPTRSMYRAIDRPGSEFRSERYPDFASEEKQKTAAEFIEELGFTHLIGVGGNGTMMGIKALDELLPNVQTGFINVSIDSDILGDIAVGYLTGAEEGAKIARSLFDDAFTHKRIYILEMMGRDSGKHALMAGASARAHLIVLPGFKFSTNILDDIAKRLNETDHALIVVAEGYERKARASFLPERVDAALHFKNQMMEHGLVETETKRVISEPFSRYLRGIRPLYIECAIAYLKAFILYDAFDGGGTKIMPYYLGEHDSGVRQFDDLGTNNQVEPRFLDLIDRYNIPALRSYISLQAQEDM